MKTGNRHTENARRRYDRIASGYDLAEGLAERWRFSVWRRLLWSKVEGNRILEVGVGTGKNMPYYPAGVEITAIDFSQKMLYRAVEKAKKLGREIDLRQMDVQDLDFEDGAFDAVVATFVFCSVPDPVKGLTEVKRVCKPGGQVLLLEHVLSANRVLALLMNLVSPLVAATMGPHINRRSVKNVSSGGLKVEKVTDLAAGIFKLIEARA